MSARRPHRSAPPPSRALTVEDWMRVLRFMRGNDAGPTLVEGLVRFLGLGRRPIQDDLLLEKSL